MGRQPVCLPQLTAFYLKTQVKLFCGCDALQVCAAWNRRGENAVVSWMTKAGRALSSAESPAPAPTALGCGDRGESIQEGEGEHTAG